MNNSAESLRQLKAKRQLALDQALRTDKNVFSIGTNALETPFVYFCGTFTSHSHTIYQPWMAKLLSLVRKKGYAGPVYLPDDRLRAVNHLKSDGVVWQDNMLKKASHVVVSLQHLSIQEAEFTAATLGMVLARMERPTDCEKNLYVFCPTYKVPCLQLRYRLGSSGIDHYRFWTVLAKDIGRSRSLI